MRSFRVSILQADGVFYEGDCESLVIPATDGQYGIQAHHSNMIAAIVPGTLMYRVPGEQSKYAAVSTGMVKVENNEVLVLVESAERPEEIDTNRARREADEAQEILLQKRSMQEYKAAQAQLSRAINRLRVKSRFEHSGL